MVQGVNLLVKLKEVLRARSLLFLGPGRDSFPSVSTGPGIRTQKNKRNG